MPGVGATRVQGLIKCVWLSPVPPACQNNGPPLIHFKGGLTGQEAPETWIACHSCVTQLATRARMETIIRTRKNQPQARALGPAMCCPMI